ncbi:DUF938 domain-containing protein [Methylobacterium sp. A54F]
MSDARHAPATLRNRAPLLEVLARVLPAAGTVLEVASGTGEHAVHFARALPALTWLPSDPDPEALASIAAHRDAARLTNLAAPLHLDAAAADWPVPAADAIVCINMIHIAPWAATPGLMDGTGRLLAPGAPLVLYGPFREAEVATVPSNLAFDASLRAQDPAWGLRDREAVAAEALVRGLLPNARIAMPANNLVLVFRKA